MLSWTSVTLETWNLGWALMVFGSRILASLGADDPLNGEGPHKSRRHVP